MQGLKRVWVATGSRTAVSLDTHLDQHSKKVVDQALRGVIRTTGSRFSAVLEPCCTSSNWLHPLLCNTFNLGFNSLRSVRLDAILHISLHH